MSDNIEHRAFFGITEYHEILYGGNGKPVSLARYEPYPMYNKDELGKFWGFASLDRKKILNEGEKLINNPQIGFVSSIEVPIQDVGEYELVLTLRLKNAPDTR